MNHELLCQYLDWDSAFFGHRIARARVSRLCPETVLSILSWCREQAIDCLYFLAEVDDPVTIRLAEDYGFRLVDIRITLEKQLDDSSAPSIEPFSGVLRSCRPEDVPVLQEIARVSHRDTRFYSDPNFLRSRCDALYELWIARSCQGYADAVFVLEMGNQPVGYITCHRQSSGEGQIGLFGVHPEWRGQGLGKRLIHHALRWFVQEGAWRVTVVTQGRNVAAQRVYQRCGFLTRKVQLWYHRWFLQERRGE